ncbi:uncharacterized protein LOC133551933 [Nerophis ophidion]|uniref:uncharacterized protein LOC133551933 n=1 Tax=Nerophis ophidion TaxID=159077 RepID=UPI002AE01EF6|nr:uncharacterized protein LOC133551933 [Nerophis ophidion]
MFPPSTPSLHLYIRSLLFSPSLPLFSPFLSIFTSIHTFSPSLALFSSSLHLYLCPLHLSIFTSVHSISPSLPPSTLSLHLCLHPHLLSIFDSIHTFSPRCPVFTRDITSCAELPEVFLLQKTPSSPVSCMATGFYPDGADLFWRKDGEQIFEDVEHGEILPNHDGTFQMSVALKVEVTADVEGKYECVFQLSGVKEDLVTKLERRSILSNASHEGEKDTFSWRCFPSQVHLSPLLIHVTMTTLDVCMQSSHEGFLFMLCHSTCAFLLSTDNLSVALAATAAVLAVAAIIIIIIIMVMVRRHRNRQGEGRQCPLSSSSRCTRSRP